MNPDIERAVKELAFSAVRYPGGWQSSNDHRGGGCYYSHPNLAEIESCGLDLDGATFVIDEWYDYEQRRDRLLLLCPV
jgi:hypothetical protein